ncbi:MAG: hypothetical protein QM731_07730 [Chitinophagaceae bacterium]
MTDPQLADKVLKALKARTFWTFPELAYALDTPDEKVNMAIYELDHELNCIKFFNAIGEEKAFGLVEGAIAKVTVFLSEGGFTKQYAAQIKEQQERRVEQENKQPDPPMQNFQDDHARELRKTRILSIIAIVMSGIAILWHVVRGLMDK